MQQVSKCDCDNLPESYFLPLKAPFTPFLDRRGCRTHESFGGKVDKQHSFEPKRMGGELESSLCGRRKF